MTRKLSKKIIILCSLVLESSEQLHLPHLTPEMNPTVPLLDAAPGRWSEFIGQHSPDSRSAVQTAGTVPGRSTAGTVPSRSAPVAASTAGSRPSAAVTASAAGGRMEALAPLAKAGPRVGPASPTAALLAGCSAGSPSGQAAAALAGRLGSVSGLGPAGPAAGGLRVYEQPSHFARFGRAWCSFGPAILNQICENW